MNTFFIFQNCKATPNEETTHSRPAPKASFKDYLLNLKTKTLAAKSKKEERLSPVKSTSKTPHAKSQKDAGEKEKKADSSSKQPQLKRQCMICKRKIHQDKLNEHYGAHFAESAKCVTCNKMCKNSPAYVSHLLTHLPPQFYCVNCEKWFRQTATFAKHTETCEKSIAVDASVKVERRGRPSKHKVSLVINHMIFCQLF